MYALIRYETNAQQKQQQHHWKMQFLSVGK